jgi:transcriptional regulator with XRE-family HTH domain
VPKVRTLRDLTASVRGRRRQLGLTQAELAARIGVSRQWLIAFEHGKGTAEIQLVLRLLDELELRISLDVISEPEGGREASVDLDALLDEHREP